MIHVSSYASRDLPPALIERLPAHAMDPRYAHKTWCGHGLPGRYADDPREATCEACLREIAQAEAVREGLAALAAALGAIGAAWRQAHDETRAAPSWADVSDDAIRAAIRDLVRSCGAAHRSSIGHHVLIDHDLRLPPYPFVAAGAELQANQAWLRRFQEERVEPVVVAMLAAGEVRWDGDRYLYATSANGDEGGES